MIPMEVFYYDFPAPNLEKSKKFYKAVLGFDVGGGSLGGHVDNTTPKCGLSPGTTDTTHTMMYLTTFDLEKTMKDVEANGGKILEKKKFPGVGTCAFCLDPNGVNIAFMEPAAEVAEHAKSPKLGKEHGDLFFLSIPAKDADKSRAFYGNVAGWKFGSVGSQGGQGVENLKGVAPGLGCGREGSRIDLWFRVSKIQDSCKTVVEANGTAGPIFEAPEGTMSQCVDDQGVKFGLVEAAEGY